jgi:hypothetical protein
MKCEIDEKPAKLMFSLVITAEGFKYILKKILLLYLFEKK